MNQIQIIYKFLFVLVLLPTVSFAQLMPWAELSTSENISSTTTVFDYKNANWSQTGLTDVAVNEMLISNDGIFYVASHGNGVLRSLDNGLTWENLPNGLPNADIMSIAEDGNGNIFIGTNGSGVYRSTDQGGSWQAHNSGLQMPFVYAISVLPNNNILAGTLSDGVYQSTDNGASWNIFSSGLPLNASVFDIEISEVNDVYITVRDHGVFILNSNNWEAVGSGLENVDVRSLTIHPNGNIFAGAWSQGAYILHAGEIVWAQTALSSIHVMDLLFAENGDLYAATHGAGVRKSADHGLSWEDYSDGLTSGGVWSLTPNVDGHIYAGTSGVGVFRSNNAVATGIESDIFNTVKKFELQQNYPNPFNPSTTIKYSIAQNANVTLKVFDITGKKVSILVNEQKIAGTYDINFSSENLVSGVYFYSLTVDNITETKRMILLK